MRKNSKSLRKPSRSKFSKKNILKKSQKSLITPLNIQHSLARKYSYNHNFHYLTFVNNILSDSSQLKQIQKNSSEEWMEKFYKSMNRKHLFPKIKEIYRIHQQIPRIFQTQVKEILNKCYHRKRLLEYFKIAKFLGIKVESVKFSSFLLSLNDSANKKQQNQEKFDPIITKISTIDFSTQVERNLLNELYQHEKGSKTVNRQNWLSVSNPESSC